MARGIDEGFEYRLKAVFSHFPMSLKAEGQKFTITNLFGEKVPRVAKLPWTPAGQKFRRTKEGRVGTAWWIRHRLLDRNRYFRV